MQKLSLLVAASVIGLGSAYSAMAQAPKPGAKATIQAPAVAAAKSNLGSFARVAPAAQAVTSPTGALSSAVNTSASAAASKASLNSAASGMGVVKANSDFALMARPSSVVTAPGVMNAKSDFALMARPSSVATVSGVTNRANMSALARAVPAAGMVNKSNFNAYAK